MTFLIYWAVSYKATSDGATGQDEQVFITKTHVRSGGHIYKETTLDRLLHAGPLDEPSAATYDPDGNPISHSWHAFGEEHRANGPSSIVFHKGTNIPMTEAYMREGRPRPAEEGPYIVRWNQDGTLWKEEYDEPYTPVLSMELEP